MKKVVLLVLLFCIFGSSLFAQTEYEAVIGDRSVLMGDSIRNVRRDVPYLSPSQYETSNVVEGMQQLSFKEVSSQYVYPRRYTFVTTDFFLNRLYKVTIYVSPKNYQHIQNEIKALKSIYGTESSSSEEARSFGTEKRKFGQVVWQFKTGGKERPNFSVILNYNEIEEFEVNGRRFFAYSLSYVYFPVFYELSYALVSAGKSALTPPY